MQATKTRRTPSGGKFHNSRRKARCGVAATELALLLPIIIGTAVTSIDLGRMLHVSLVLGNSVRMGADYVATRGVTSDSQAAVTSEITNQVATIFTDTVRSEVEQLEVVPTISLGSGNSHTTRIQASCVVPILFSWGGLFEDVTIGRSLVVQCYR